MEASAKTQRRRAYRKTAGSSAVRIEMKDATGNPRGATADVVDMIDGGLGLSLATPVKSGSIVVVHGRLGVNRTADHIKAVVRWCVGKTDGTFRAGLEFLEKLTDSVHPDTLDCYEVMQLSPHADRDAISRAYRLLALRYHPDNNETGNSEMFIRLSGAYQILSDPARRAIHDARRRGARTLRCKTSDRPSNFRPAVGNLCGWDAALRAL